MMRKIRFRYIKENGKSTSVTVRCSMKRNASLISEALRHYQRVERQHDRRHYPQEQCSTTPHHFDPIQLRNKQCSSTLIDEEIPIIDGSMSSAFRSDFLSTADERRINVIREIYTTEFNYLGHLRTLVEIYLKKMRERTDLFTEKQIAYLMGNLEEIYAFQQTFFNHLQTSIDVNQVHRTLIGQCFLLYKDQFKKYTHYCINHPLSSLELAKLEKDPLYQQFFESCRFDGFLLTPIERLCQYPLQLSELLKWTNEDHDDYFNLSKALESMRDVLSFINEQKRRMESIEILHRWQQSVEAWQGSDLIETSSEGLGRFQAYLHDNGEKQLVILYLFDHLLLISRQDQRRIYLGRIDLDRAQFDDHSDGKLSWSIVDRPQKKRFLFSHRTSEEKIQILDALAFERNYVQEKRSKTFHTPLWTRLVTEQILQSNSICPSDRSSSFCPCVSVYL